jgi:hypothetical protein
MPMFDDPLADGEEARLALRAIAHATCTFASPSQTHELIGELQGELRSLHQALGQAASAHTRHKEFAFTNDGDHWGGVEEAFVAGNALARAVCAEENERIERRLACSTHASKQRRSTSRLRWRR